MSTGVGIPLLPLTRQIGGFYDVRVVATAYPTEKLDNMCAKKRQEALSLRQQHDSAIRRQQEQGGGDDPLELLVDTARRQDKTLLNHLAREIGINYAEAKADSFCAKYFPVV